MATILGFEHIDHPITAHDFILKVGKDSYCRQASYIVDYRDQRIRSAGMDFRYVLNPLRLFSANDGLQFVAMDMQGLLPSTIAGHQFVLVVTGR